MHRKPSRLPRENFDTVRCASCAVFVSVADVTRASDGRAHCDVCGPPKGRSAPFAASGRVGVDLDWEVGALRADPLADRNVRLVALAMLAVTAMFPLAACLSQL